MLYIESNRQLDEAVRSIPLWGLLYIVQLVWSVRMSSTEWESTDQTHKYLLVLVLVHQKVLSERVLILFDQRHEYLLVHVLVHRVVLSEYHGEYWFFLIRDMSSEYSSLPCIHTASQGPRVAMLPPPRGVHREHTSDVLDMNYYLQRQKKV